MVRKALVAMESYRLAQYAVPISCYICGGDNNYDVELCRHCSAPMALSHQANSQGIEPGMIAVLGTAAAGKTVYLGMLLDMLTRRNNRVQVLARGAFSITLQQRTMAALAASAFPEKTPNEPDRWNWVHCQAKLPSQKRPIELIMPDMAGEAILEEVDHPHSYPAIHSFLKKCAGVLLLIDTERIEDGSQEQNYFMMKLITYLSEQSQKKRRGKCVRPMAIVFSKADQCDPCFANPDRYARDRTPNLWQQIGERFETVGFFASSVTGACTQKMDHGLRVNVPLRIEPRGIVEPFEWLIRKV
ncbi:hypothetical protein M4951_20160 [Blastopirellula sp. J2-11]|uniref:TRAFAC clade GTPase domain-containing protein n=1 Tax=Blastopirellula sp. J2-11 TaxID=2943192 RepID=UPI0021C7E5E8|nr:hypothetical protein [Blastopirellula sp. J2-11]UUO05677.1 hypothetical protein M4951_20160 [Blastopirellula sp. J2-11]